MEQKIRVGLIVPGALAARVYIPIDHALVERAELTAVLGRTAEKTEAFARRNGIPLWFTELNPFLASGLDAVVLTTPKTVRGAYIIPLLEAGVDILVEKPLAESIADYEAFSKLAVRHHRVLAVGFNRRFAPLNPPGHRGIRRDKAHLHACAKMQRDA